MTRDDIIRMAREAGFEDGYGNHLFPPGDYREEVIPVTEELERFAALVAAEKEAQMIRDGYRKCSEGQRTTRFCALLEEAVAAEREKVARWMISHGYATGHGDTTEDLLEELEWQIKEEKDKG